MSKGTKEGKGASTYVMGEKEEAMGTFTARNSRRLDLRLRDH